ncbi:unnamed protein product [Urochloa humidicola]
MAGPSWRALPLLPAGSLVALQHRAQKQACCWDPTVRHVLPSAGSSPPLTALLASACSPGARLTRWTHARLAAVGSPPDLAARSPARPPPDPARSPPRLPPRLACRAAQGLAGPALHSALAVKDRVGDGGRGLSGPGCERRGDSVGFG